MSLHSRPLLLVALALCGFAAPGCGLFTSGDLVDTLDGKAGGGEGAPGEVSLQVKDWFGKDYDRVVFICDGATEADVLPVTGPYWEGAAKDDEDRFSPPAKNSAFIYRDRNRPGMHSYVSSTARRDTLDVCTNLGAVVAEYSAEDTLSFSREEQGGPWVLSGSNGRNG